MELSSMDHYHDTAAILFSRIPGDQTEARREIGWPPVCIDYQYYEQQGSLPRRPQRDKCMFSMQLTELA